MNQPANQIAPASQIAEGAPGAAVAPKTVALNLLAGMLSPSQPWNEFTADLFSVAMLTWADDIALEACKWAALNLKWRPAPVELREIAAKLAAPAPGAAAARAEVRRVLLYHGPRAGTEAQAGTHPLIHAIADEMGGWATVSRMYTEQIDQEFPSAYERAVKAVAQLVADTLLPLPRAERERALCGGEVTRRIAEGATSASAPRQITDSDAGDRAASVRVIRAKDPIPTAAAAAVPAAMAPTASRGPVLSREGAQAAWEALQDAPERQSAMRRIHQQRVQEGPELREAA